jgi:hypothetical protein
LPPMNERERRDYSDETWLMAGPSEAELELSPIGKITLEMLKNSKPVGDGVQRMDGVSSPELVPYDTNAAVPAEQPIPPIPPPPGPSDDLFERMEQERAAKLEREQTNPPWKWDMLKPSAPDKSLRPLAPSDWDNDLDNNRPIY